MPNTGEALNGWFVVPARLRALLARAETGVWVTAADGRIVFWNPAAEAALGFCARDVCGRTCADVLSGYDAIGRPICGPGCGAADMANRIGASFGVPTHAKDGREVWLDVTTFTTNGHAPALTVHVFHDTTRTRQFLRDLREQLGHTRDEPRLTPRELQVLRLMADGLGTAAVAARLRVSRATIRNHVQNIFGKLGVHTRLEAVAHATRHCLL